MATLCAYSRFDFIYTAIQQIMSDELVNKFTWLGDKSSKQLADTKMNIIYCKWFYIYM